ncbi:MAG: oxidoreductase [Bacteroidetes bacterium B1(2017)]|nr:MAG: oxidoreductase [Bacteroidetes bacterium B1(2017)]
MKKYMIVGGTSGIGHQIAQDLLAQNHTVFILSRNPQDKEQLPLARYLSCDVKQDITTFPNIEEPLDGLIYCPGSIVLKPFRGLKQEDLLNDLEINYLGAIKCIQKYLPNLQQGTNASIVLFSSVAVQKGMTFHSSIAGAKGAIEGLTKSLAAEFAPKIRVNAIAPSLTQTPLAEKLINTESKMEAAAQRHPLKRIGNPKDISEAVCFMLGATWLTGEIMALDGGMKNIG